MSGTFIAKPPSEARAGVLVLHAWWGLTEDVRSYASSLAAEGMLTHAPDMFDGQTAGDIPSAQALRSAIDRKALNQLLIAAADEILTALDDRPLRLVGFSLGASWAVSLAKYRPERVDRIVLYYGKGTGSLGKLNGVSVRAHLAEEDPYLGNYDTFEANAAKSGVSLDTYRYPGTHHWFAEPSSPSYDVRAADLAYRRTVEFLKGSSIRS